MSLDNRRVNVKLTFIHKIKKLQNNTEDKRGPGKFIFTCLKKLHLNTAGYIFLLAIVV